MSKKLSDDRTEREEWAMPTWMEPFRGLIQNTGGNSIEDLMNDHDSNSFNNIIRAGLICSVDSQVTLLHRLAQRGMLSGVDPKKDGLAQNKD